MEESQNQSQGESQESSQAQEDKVSFPTVGESKKGGGAKTLLIIGILVLVGILGYVIYKSATGESQDVVETNPTPYENVATPASTTLATPSSSPSASVDKTKIKIQVQNGTGITGEAAYLETQLGELGYTNVTVGNSSTQDQRETNVSFASSVPATVVNEITSKLNTVYQTVTKISSTGTTYDVVIVTGLRKGATPKASSTPTPTPTSSPTPTTTETPTP